MAGLLTPSTLIPFLAPDEDDPCPYHPPLQEGDPGQGRAFHRAAAAQPEAYREQPVVYEQGEGLHGADDVRHGLPQQVRPERGIFHHRSPPPLVLVLLVMLPLDFLPGCII